MKPKYCIGQRLDYIAKNECTFNGNKVEGIWKHYVGYVKQVRRSLFGVTYVMIVHRDNQIHIVPQRDIIGVVKPRDTSNNNSNKSDDNDC